MGLYSKYALPALTHWACSRRPAMRQRAKVVPGAWGRVLEIGVGSGLNFPYYDPARIEGILAIDPSAGLRARARKAAETLALPVDFVDGAVEDVDLEPGSVDTAVCTFTMCTIPDAERALRRVAGALRPGGKLLFCEHGASPDSGVRRWQDRMDGIWGRFAGGCHLNREIPRTLEAGGFRITRLETMYLPGWKPAAFNYWGSAEPAVTPRIESPRHAT